MKSFYIYAIPKTNIEIALKKQLVGLSKKSKLFSEISKGDEIVFYQTGEGEFIARGIFTKEHFPEGKLIWPEEKKTGEVIYPYRLKVKVKKFKNRVDIDRVLYGLGFIKNKEKYGGYLRTSLIRIPQKDYEKIISASKKPTKNFGVSQALGNTFQNRVGYVLKLLGFNVTNMGSKEGPDIILKDNENGKNYKIIIQCKATATIRPYPTLSSLIDEYATKVRNDRAKLAIIFLSNYKIPGKFNREKIVQKDKVAILTGEFLDYYEDLYKKIGNFAKYQFLADIGADITYGPNLKAPAIAVSQNKYNLYISAIDAEWLLKTSAVLRRITDDTGRYQRILKTSRVKTEIPAFLLEDWVLPNNLVLATKNKNIIFDNGEINLPNISGLFWVVDGQHRLYSFSNIPEKLRKQKLICTILDTNKIGEDADAKLAKIFVDLNFFAKKVDPSLIIELSDTIGSTDPKLKIALNLYKTKTFSGLISSYSKKGGGINLTTLATNGAMKTLVNPNGPLIKGKHKSFDGIVEFCTSMLDSYFKIVAQSFGNLWGDKEYIISDNRGVRALLRFYLRILKEHGVKNIDQNIRKAMRALCSSDFDFSLENAKAQYLGEAGADKLAIEWLTKVKSKLPKFSVGSDIKRESYNIPSEEDENVEFKSSLRWNVNEEKESDELKFEVVRGISALMNTDGGEMFIGVDDQGNVIGLEKDLSLHTGNLNQKKDKFKRQIHSLIAHNIGGIRVFDENIESVSIKEIDGKLICAISVKRSKFPVFFKKKLYRRFGASSVAVEAEDLVDYAKKKILRFLLNIQDSLMHLKYYVYKRRNN